MGSSSKSSSDPAIDRSDDAPAGLPQLVILLALSLLFFLPKLGMPFLDPDEGLYATIAQEMLGDGDWVIPHVNGLPYLEKPPLYFWLTALAFRVAGPSEWATRLPSALAALGTVTLTWRVGRRLYGARAGLLAGLVVATVVGNQLLRFLDARGYIEDDVSSSTLGFLVASFIWAFPWSVFSLARGKADASPHARWRPFILIWLVVVVGLFALSRFKHEYYALP